ncbi:MAG TPA: ATP-binding protein [Pyrinomonadaceae bacterium]|jgi:two-component system sensor histidine kinase CpxA
MRSLFLKVFLWFWLAMALVILALVLTSELTRPDDAFPRDSLIDKYTTFIAQDAARAYEREGQPGLAAFLQNLDRQTGVRPRLYDADGRELSGLGQQPGAQDLIARAGSRDVGPMRGSPRAQPLVGFPVLTAEGRRYVFIVQPGPRPALPTRALWSLVPRILAVLLTAGALCYLLARYIVSPVVKLRAVTKQVAGGDLSARVGPLLGGRRDELAEMGRDFDLMAAKIETLMTSQQRLLRDISHELRSPLARLNVALDLARRRAGDKATGALERIERESRRINEMIGQILTLIRGESDADGLTEEMVDLSRLVTEVSEDADFEARSQNRTVRVVVNDDCRTAGSYSLLRSAVENVIRNAVHYTDEGTTVEVSHQRRSVNGDVYGVITVRDHGPGVPEETLADIFRPFYRVEEARDPDSGGTGLGLAITARSVSLHKGTVRAFNAPDRGLIVEMRIPVSGRAASLPGL